MRKCFTYCVGFFLGSFIFLSGLSANRICYKQSFASLGERYSNLSYRYSFNSKYNLFDDWAILFRSWSNTSNSIIGYPRCTGETFEYSMSQWFCDLHGSVDNRLSSAGFEKKDNFVLPCNPSWCSRASGSLPSKHTNRFIGQLMFKAIKCYALMFRRRSSFERALWSTNFDIVITYEDSGEMFVYCVPNMSYVRIIQKTIVPLIKEHAFNAMTLISILWLVNKAIFVGALSLDDKLVCDTDPETEVQCDELMDFIETHKNESDLFWGGGEFCQENQALCSVVYNKLIPYLCADGPLSCFYHAFEMLINCGW